MFFDYSRNGNPYYCPHCNFENNILCTNKINWNVDIINVDFTDPNMSSKICNDIDIFFSK